MPEARALAAAAAHPDLFGFIVREVATGAIIVSIRGTLVPEEWLRNFTAIPADYSFLPNFGTTHLGFRLVYASVRASIQQGLAAVPANARVTVVGHSLGGAMATLAGPDVKRNLNRRTWTSARLAALAWASRTFAGSSTRRSRGVTG